MKNNENISGNGEEIFNAGAAKSVCSVFFSLSLSSALYRKYNYKRSNLYIYIYAPGEKRKSAAAKHIYIYLF